MHILADENQHPLVVARLRADGHEVEWIAESMPGAPDTAILKRSDIGSLVLLTYDRDFGDLIFRRRYPTPAAIIYTRLNRADPLAIAERLSAILEAGPAIGHMIAVTRDIVRVRPFPLGETDG